MSSKMLLCHIIPPNYYTLTSVCLLENIERYICLIRSEQERILSAEKMKLTEVTAVVVEVIMETTVFAYSTNWAATETVTR